MKSSLYAIVGFVVIPTILIIYVLVDIGTSFVRYLKKKNLNAEES